MGELIGTVVESTLYYVPKEEFDRVRSLNKRRAAQRTQLFADMCRLNTLYMIARAGSGHIGSSFSSLDIVRGSISTSLRKQATTGLFLLQRATTRRASMRC